VVEATAHPAGIVGWLDRFGRMVIRGFDELGRFFYIMASGVLWTFRRPFDIPELLRQMVRVGWDSIPVVFLTCLFTGMVLALQTYRGFERFHAEGFVGSVVALSLTRELAPVLTGLMVAGRVGSAMAAELGTMRVTEQIDALYTMATEPIHYLVVPRVNASILMLPVLTVMGDAIGIIGGWLVSVGLFGANSYLYVERTFQFLEVNDVTSGLIKSAFFGLILSVTGCAKGFYTSGGAEGVGRSTTSAVVTACLYILLSDFFLTKILF
jgi:phospholipid/cholesterol/gamma-HCH transport system permease protein